MTFAYSILLEVSIAAYLCLIMTLPYTLRVCLTAYLGM